MYIQEESLKHNLTDSCFSHLQLQYKINVRQFPIQINKHIYIFNERAINIYTSTVPNEILQWLYEG